MQRYGELQTHANKTAFVRLLRGGTARRLESVKPSDTGLIKTKVMGCGGGTVPSIEGI